MDYILQTEKIFKYLNFNLEACDFRFLTTIKKKFNNDLNLIGCFIKDILTLENNGKISDDNEIYNDFVLCFEKHKIIGTQINFLNKINQYSTHYLTIVFEDTQDRVLLNTIVSINSCFNIEYYPFLMELMDKYINKKINGISYALMLQFLTDTVFKNYENINSNVIELNELRKKLQEFSNLQTIKRQTI